jgi:hypothetical protein
MGKRMGLQDWHYPRYGLTLLALPLFMAVYDA